MKLASSFQKFKKTVLTLRVNDIKGTSKNDFKELCFKRPCGFLTSLLTLTHPLPHIWTFMNYFSFSQFFSFSCQSWNVTPNPLHSGLSSK